MHIILVSLLFGSVLCQRENGYEIPVEYSVDEGETFRLRGTIHLSLSKFDSGRANYYKDVGALSNGDLTGLEHSATSNGLYRIRVPGSMDNTDGMRNYRMSFTKSCLLLQSELSDIITLSVDSTRNKILSVAIQPFDSRKVCDFDSMQIHATNLEYHNTSIQLIDIVEGPVPDTQSYLMQIEEEKKKREQQTPQQNQSFIAKYWMYIVPAVILLMMSSMANPQAAQA